MPEFTGERVVPGQVEVDLWNEHVSRYVWARRFAAGRTVLDAGCGTGYGSAELAKSAAVVVGVDVDSATVSWAAREYGGPNVEWTAASCIDLPFADATFDLVISFEVIEHLADQRKFLQECSRVLTANGLLLVSTPNKAYYTDARAGVGENPWHVREMDAQEFDTELRAVFPQVTILLQNRFECLGIYPAQGDERAEAYIEGFDGALGESTFFIGVCSRRELPPPASFLYVPRASNLLRERERHMATLETCVKEARQRIVELQEELAAEQAAAAQQIRRLESELEAEQAAAQRQIDELETENQSKTEWAQNVQMQLDQCAQLLSAAENRVVERTGWAQRLDAQVRDLEHQLAMVAASRWVRAGRKLGVGPVIPLFEKPAG